jgi:hypothetical protein
MAISIDWGTKIINVPQSFLTLVSGTTYTMNVNSFREALKGLEDDFEGMSYPDTHRHVSPITLSGVTYARFVEIINGYTITFEDGLYQVNLSGANNNIVDVLNRNSVSVVANNSSGLILSDQELSITPSDVANIAGAVWNKLVAEHVEIGTFGERIGKKLLTSGKFIALK